MKKVLRTKKRDLEFPVTVRVRAVRGAAMKSKSSSQQSQRSKS